MVESYFEFYSGSKWNKATSEPYNADFKEEEHSVSPLNKKNTQPEVNFPGSYIK